MERTGANLALMLLTGFQTLVDGTQRALDELGHADHRSVHHFAMRAIAAGADSASELGRRLDVSRQAAAKTIAVLEARGYVVRTSDEGDARRKRLVATDLGLDLLRQGEAAMQRQRSEWADKVGSAELEQLEDRLAELVGEPVGDDAAKWMSRGLDAAG